MFLFVINETNSVKAVTVFQILITKYSKESYCVSRARIEKCRFLPALLKSAIDHNSLLAF